MFKNAESVRNCPLLGMNDLNQVKYFLHILN